ncbi:MAG TPA: nuclear transport factor 2 family protein, partial [Solimonas sp.]|nr:nuclear transport factor 2 family protein [Solimonas sp.]
MIDAAGFAQLTRDVQQLQDRQAILDCIQRECRARDRQDAAQIAGCWWEDGVGEHGAAGTAKNPSYERPIVARPGGLRW